MESCLVSLGVLWPPTCNSWEVDGVGAARGRTRTRRRRREGMKVNITRIRSGQQEKPLVVWENKGRERCWTVCLIEADCFQGCSQRFTLVTWSPGQRISVSCWLFVLIKVHDVTMSATCCSGSSVTKTETHISTPFEFLWAQQTSRWSQLAEMRPSACECSVWANKPQWKQEVGLRVISSPASQAGGTWITL